MGSTGEFTDGQADGGVIDGPGDGIIDLGSLRVGPIIEIDHNTLWRRTLKCILSNRGSDLKAMNRNFSHAESPLSDRSSPKPTVVSPL